MSRSIPASNPSAAPQASPDAAQRVPGVASLESVSLPEQWEPSSDDFDLRTAHGVEHYWASIHRCGRAYRRHISEALSYSPANERNETRTMAPFIDLELEPSPWADNGRFAKKGNPTVWEVAGPANDSTPADRRLLRGTLLEPAGWTGDQTEGMELLVWKTVGGSIGGRSHIHTPVGGRYGAHGWLVTALLVDPREELLRDAKRSADLLSQLAQLAASLIHAPLPQVPSAVRDVLDEALTLDPARLIRLVQTPSDHWPDSELRKLEERARAAADPDLARALAWAVGETLHRALQGRQSKGNISIPTNFLVWQALRRAALAQMTPGLTANEITRLSEGWARIKAKTRHSQHWWSRRAPSAINA